MIYVDISDTVALVLHRKRRFERLALSGRNDGDFLAALPVPTCRPRA